MLDLKYIFAALLVSTFNPALPQAFAAEQTEAALLEKTIPLIDAHFQKFQQDRHVPGLAYGIVKDGKLIHTGLLGVQELETRRPVTKDSLFRIASMSKAFTALAILKLRDEGRLSLDALAETYVPEMKGWRYPTTDSPRIRVRDLLSHTAGFVTDNPWGDRQQPLPEAEFSRMLREGVPFTRAPGMAFEYSNFGYALLGRIVTNVSGRPYKDYIEKEIIRPLGMTSTGFDINEAPREKRAIGYRWENDAHVVEPDMAHGVFGAMGGIETSVTDYARYTAWLLSAWPPRDGEDKGPVRRSSVRELAEGLGFPNIAQRPGLDGQPACQVASAYGKGMSAAKNCELGFTLSHSGGYPGYGSYLFLLPDQNVGIFAFANGTYSAPIRAVHDSALELHRAGFLVGREFPVSSMLAKAYAASGAMYNAGELGPGQGVLAMNFLMDRSADNWKQEFARLKQKAGTCQVDAAIKATGALSGQFTWTCESAKIRGNLILAPTKNPEIQELVFTLIPLQ